MKKIVLGCLTVATAVKVLGARGARSARAARTLGRFRGALSVALVLGLAFPWAPTALAQGSRVDAGLDELARQRRMLELVQGGVDTSRFDLDELRLDAAFMDAPEIGEFVASSYRFELYRGVLRGPQGTLVSGAGNALDLSVLLATLLRDAGYDSRVALGLLGSEDAERLLTRALEARPEAREVVNDGDDMVAELAQVAGVSEAELIEYRQALASADLRSSDRYQESVTASAALIQALADGGVNLQGASHEDLVAEAKEYAWVEYRLGANDAWGELHPAFGALAAPAPLTADEYLEGSVPDRLQHRLRIEVGIERKRGDVFTEEHLMTPWERPVANMLGVNLSVANSPLGQSADATLQELGTSLSGTLFFVPLLNGAMAPGAKAFDTLGNLLSPEDAASAMAGVFQTAASKLNKATGALGALGSDGPADAEPFALTAQFVDVVHIAPGGQEARQRRYIFDRRAGDARALGGTALLDESVLLNGILTNMEIMVTGGSLPLDFLAHDAAEQGLHYLDAMERLLQEPDQAGLQLAFADVRGREQLLLMALFEAAGPSSGGVAYRAEPTVVSIRQALTIGEAVSGEMGVDIVFSGRRFLVNGPSGVMEDPESAVMAGAWDTMVERLYMQRFTPEVASAYSVFGAGAPLRVVKNESELAGSGAPTEALPAMQRDLSAGNVLVYSDTEAAAFGWWRVDPRTGATLGMGSGGHGTAFTEYLIELSPSLAFTAALAVPGVFMCTTLTGTALALCICDMVVGAVVFTGIGIGIGAAFAGASLTISQAVTAGSFLAIDVGVGVTSLLVGGPCNWVAGAVSDSSSKRCILA